MLVEKIKTYWEQTKMIGEIKVPRKCFTQMIRGDEDSFNEAFYRSSYLAKERSKFVGGDRSFGSSRLANKAKKKPVSAHSNENFKSDIQIPMKLIFRIITLLSFLIFKIKKP